MSAATQTFFALDRTATEEFLAMAVKDMDDLTLKNAVHTLVSCYRPSLLRDLNKTVVPACCEAIASAAAAAPVPVTVPQNQTVAVEEEMRTATDENVARLMRKKRIDWEAAWTELRCKELEDGASICCSEECEGNDSAIDELVWAVEAGKKNRKERRIAQGRPVSPDASEAEDSVKAPYIAPPKVRDAELNWPFMRCKNVVKTLQRSQSMWIYGEPPKNHHGLLEYIAKFAKVSVEVLKKTHPHDIFKDYPAVMRVLAKSSRW
jgi:hypothetical protein